MDMTAAHFYISGRGACNYVNDFFPRFSFFLPSRAKAGRPVTNQVGDEMEQSITFISDLLKFATK